MKILVVTDVLWRDDNGVGNSYSNIFNEFPEAIVANVCCQQGVSKNGISQRCFQISESSLLRNLKNKSVPTGCVEEPATESKPENPKGLFALVKKSRLQIFFWLRNFIWKIGKWKSKELREFIDEFEPDLIFAQLQDKVYLNNLVGYIKKHTQKPLYLYAWDDVYSLKQFSLSPLFWIDRFMQRRSIKKIVKQCEILYTISQEQQLEYAKSLKARTKLLYKGYNFDKAEFPTETKSDEPLKILYTGNLYSGRYKTLQRVCTALNEINGKGKKAELAIYSATNLSDKQVKKLNFEGSSHFFGKISEAEVQVLQKDADILLHIEPFSLKGSLLCRLSFSTKLVDYFYNKKCIFAVGHKRCSSMKYLQRFDAAIVAEEKGQIQEKLEALLHAQEMKDVYAKKAWECGQKNHQIADIQNELFKDFKALE